MRNLGFKAADYWAACNQSMCNRMAVCQEPVSLTLNFTLLAFSKSCNPLIRNVISLGGDPIIAVRSGRHTAIPIVVFTHSQQFFEPL